MKLERKFWLRFLLLTILIAAAVRLFGFAARFGKESLQSDFSIYYTAGEALNQNLSPYQNHFQRNPMIWDRMGFYYHSQFVYTPIVAQLFRPFAVLPYHFAKHLWMICSVMLLVFALIETVKLVDIRIPPEMGLLLGIFVCLYHPLLTLLERGQIDIVTLFLIVYAFKFLIRGRRREEWIGGAILALATLIKVHCAYFFPFLILRRKWAAALGYIGGGALIGILSLILLGVDTHRTYFFERMPSMSKYGTDRGSIEDSLPLSAVLSLLSHAPYEMREREGIRYKLSGLGFTYNATLVRMIEGSLHRKDNYISYQSVISAIVYVIFFAVVGLLELFVFGKRKGPFTKAEDLIYLQLVLIIVLLCAPTTFVMNTVWLIPNVLIAYYLSVTRETKREGKFLWLTWIGLILAAMPDVVALNITSSPFQFVLENKYVFAELLIFVSYVMILIERRSKPAVVSAAA